MADIMGDCDMIVVEEPPHPLFAAMLSREASIEELLFDSDFEYPAFVRQYYQLMRKLYAEGKQIVQAEPFLETLLRIHGFFAEGHGPDEIRPGSIMRSVYEAEKDATFTLIEFYKASQNRDFNALLEALQTFVQADARRFVLRDTMRADSIESLADPALSICVEAGHMHRYLYCCLKDRKLRGCSIHARFLEEEIAAASRSPAGILSPGDELTLAAIFGENLGRERQDLLAARALIYSKVIHKEEIDSAEGEYPHLEDELATINLVNTLSLEACRNLYYKILRLSTVKARQVLENVVS